MLHRALMLGSSVVLGAITTIALAWACAAWVNPARVASTFTTQTTSANTLMGVATQSRFGHTRVNRATLVNFVRDPDTGAVESIGIRADATARSEDFTGWPCRSMVCINEGEITLQLNGAQMQTRLTGTPGRLGLLQLSPWPGGMSCWRALPARPVLVGFAIDTSIYAAIWAGLLIGFGSLRRARRRQAGLCAHCGYDLRGGRPIGEATQICPECGAADAIVATGSRP